MMIMVSVEVMATPPPPPSPAHISNLQSKSTESAVLCWSFATFIVQSIMDRGGRCSLFLTMQCFQILNDAIFRRCFEKNTA